MHGHAGCGHESFDSQSVDPRFADDSFTQAAIQERRVLVGHLHAVTLAWTLVGGLVFVAAARRLLCGSR